MGTLKDKVITRNGKIHFVPSGSGTSGAIQKYAVTMSGAALSQSVLAPNNATASYWYFRSSTGYSVKVWYQNDSGNAVEPTSSTLAFSTTRYLQKTGSSVKVILTHSGSGSTVLARTHNALISDPNITSRFSMSFTTSSISSGLLFIDELSQGAPPADSMSFAYVSGSSISANVVQVGLRDELQDQYITGSADATIELFGTGLRTDLPNTGSHLNLKDGFFGVVNTNGHTASNVSLHGGPGFNYGQPLPNAAYIKSQNGFDFLLDQSDSYTNTQFRIFKDDGLAATDQSTELFKIDENGNLTTLGSIDGGTY